MKKKKAHVRKNNVEKYCNNSQCFVRKAFPISFSFSYNSFAQSEERKDLNPLFLYLILI